MTSGSPSSIKTGLTQLHGTEFGFCLRLLEDAAVNALQISQALSHYAIGFTSESRLIPG